MVDFNNATNPINVDIVGFYKSFIIEIDKMRNRTVSYGDKMLDTIISNIDGSSKEYKELSTDRSGKESRRSAFYRMLGLPIISNNQIYSPGYDKSDSVSLEDKIKIAKSLDDNFYKLFDLREITSQKNFDLLDKKDFRASLTAASIADVRNFNFSFEKEQQEGISYLEKKDLQLRDVKFLELAKSIKDSDGYTISDLSSKRYHIIKPLIVDPRSDFTANERRMAIPFANNKTDLKFNEKTQLKRPYIESICRTRFGKDSSIPNTAYYAEIINDVKNDELIKDQVLISSVFKGDIDFTQVKLINYLSFLSGVLMELVKNVDKLNDVLTLDPYNSSTALYSWVPIPKTGSLEIEVDAMPLSSVPTDILTNEEKNISAFILRKEFYAINRRVKDIDSVDLGGFAFDDSSLFPEPNEVISSQIDEQLQELTSRRDFYIKDANSASKIVEIITGEFSGLGIVDIIAFFISLWTLDRKDIIHLMDSKAFDRMKTQLSLADEYVDGYSETALKNLEQRVKEAYNLIETMYQGIYKENTK